MDHWVDSEEGQQIFKLTLSKNDIISGSTLNTPVQLGTHYL